MNKENFKAPVFITFIGIILLLFGFYTSTRTMINLVFFTRYPTSGVMSFNLFGVPGYAGPREEDCKIIYPPKEWSQGKSDGLSEIKLEEQKSYETQQETQCLSSVKEARNQAKINDISLSLFLLFLGSGILVSRKYINLL